MQTRGEVIIEDAKNTYNRLQALGHETFSLADLSKLIEPFTSRLESFLKSVIFPAASRKETLYRLVENLGSLGVKSSTTDALHRLRELYNESKHDPNSDLTLQRCIVTLAAVIHALNDISALKLPAVEAIFEHDIRSLVYVGFWDHYVGGETEVGLFLPSDHWLGTSPISTFHFPMSSWDTVKSFLTDHPRYTEGENALGSQLWKSFAEEGDFLSAGVWEGDIRELLMILSSFNDEKLERAILPSLARKNDLLSVGIALVSAAVDVARGNENASGPQLQNAVSHRAKVEYAVDTDTPESRAVLDRITCLLDSVPAKHRGALAGPAFQRRKFEPAGNEVPLILERATFVWLIA